MFIYKNNETFIRMEQVSKEILQHLRNNLSLVTVNFQSKIWTIRTNKQKYIPQKSFQACRVLAPKTDLLLLSTCNNPPMNESVKHQMVT